MTHTNSTAPFMKKALYLIANPCPKIYIAKYVITVENLIRIVVRLHKNTREKKKKDREELSHVQNISHL